jgi:hypothetical protein
MLSKFSTILLDMNDTFMFGADSPEEQLSRRKRRLIDERNCSRTL